LQKIDADNHKQCGKTEQQSAAIRTKIFHPCSPLMLSALFRCDLN
jgi:hypothetical protein